MLSLCHLTYQEILVEPRSLGSSLKHLVTDTSLSLTFGLGPVPFVQLVFISIVITFADLILVLLGGGFGDSTRPPHLCHGHRLNDYHYEKRKGEYKIKAD